MVRNQKRFTGGSQREASERCWKKSAETQVTSLSSELARTFGNETENSLDESRSLPFGPIDSVIFSLK